MSDIRDLFQQKEAASKSKLVEDDALEWLKPRTLIKPDDQEDVTDAVRFRLLMLTLKIA